MVTGILIYFQLEQLAETRYFVRVWLSVLLLAPLAFFMGTPFPLALNRVAILRPDLVPWAWGVNGCASVVGPVLCILLALQLGLATVFAIAIALYATTLWSIPRESSDPLEPSGSPPETG